MWRIWKADKFDFLVVLGTFFGVIFENVEIGLLVGVALSMIKLLVNYTRPLLVVQGEVPGSGVYRSIQQYTHATDSPGILVIRVDAPILFTNANFVRERTVKMATKYEDQNDEPLTVRIIIAVLYVGCM